MIHVSRKPDPPDIPVFTRVKKKENKTAAELEREAAIAFFSNPANYQGESKVTTQKFGFSVYKNGELARELEAVFGGKCAYCESRFAHVTPKDVEHFRPKSEIAIGPGKSLMPGYYWLAGDWRNLLVSCVDCNRARNHLVPGQADQLLLGKETQFPLSEEGKRVRSHEKAIADEEAFRLLLNPCEDDPELHLAYDDDALIHPRTTEQGVPSAMAEASICVYALQRKELVEERLLVLRQLMFNFVTLSVAARRCLKAVQSPIPDPQAIADEKAEFTRLKSNLKEAFKPSAPYVGMARDYVRRTQAAHGFDDLIQFGINPVDEFLNSP